MYLLDTDHLSLLDRGGEAGARVKARLGQISPDDVAVSIISYEEQMRGWLAEIARISSVEKQQAAYERLLFLQQSFCSIPLLPFDEAAVSHFQTLWLARVKIGTMDLKIAAVALANDATLLTRNTQHFSKVPGLKFADWSV